jgi:hypothetical protein
MRDPSSAINYQVTGHSLHSLVIYKKPVFYLNEKFFRRPENYRWKKF